jgi:hypothetical protein
MRDKTRRLQQVVNTKQATNHSPRLLQECLLNGRNVRSHEMCDIAERGRSRRYPGMVKKLKYFAELRS